MIVFAASSAVTSGSGVPWAMIADLNGIVTDSPTQLESRPDRNSSKCPGSTSIAS